MDKGQSASLEDISVCTSFAFVKNYYYNENNGKCIIK